MPPPDNKIVLYNPRTDRLEEEPVVGESWIRFLYTHPVGKSLTEIVFKRRPLSALYGLWASSPLSVGQIPNFASRYKIPLNDFSPPEKGYRSFNDFFIRKYRTERIAFPSDRTTIGSPAEGRLKAIPNLGSQTAILVKGEAFDTETLLADHHLAETFQGGSALICRLCPLDYHRFHFLDAGIPEAPQIVSGHLHSVNPIALRQIPRLLVRNRRMITLFHSEHFGEIAHVEVGAMMVGSIRQTHPPQQPVSRGDEKGYFAFGGSTVILLFQPGRIHFDKKILIHSQAGRETRVWPGTPIAHSS